MSPSVTVAADDEGQALDSDQSALLQLPPLKIVGYSSHPQPRISEREKRYLVLGLVLGAISGATLIAGAVLLCSMLFRISIISVSPSELPLPSLDRSDLSVSSPSTASAPSMEVPYWSWIPSASEDHQSIPSLAGLSGYNASLTPSFPPLLLLNNPLPSSLPFQVDINSQRMQRLMALVRSGIGVVIGVIGASVSSGIHVEANSTFDQRQRWSYGGQFVEWLNVNYPVQHVDTYRFLTRHTLWNAAKPATDSQWSSFCLEQQFREIEAVESFAQEGNTAWVRQHREELERRGWSKPVLEIDHCVLGKTSNARNNMSSSACMLRGFHMPDMLLIEFSINNRDHRAEPSAEPLCSNNCTADSEIDQDILSEPEFSGAALGSGEAIGSNVGEEPGWASASMERIIYSVLSRSELPTAVLQVHLCFSSDRLSWFHSSQIHHQAVGDWYHIPFILWRDEILWNPLLLSTLLDSEQLEWKWWKLQGSTERPHPSYSPRSRLHEIWQNLEKRFYADAVHLSRAGHEMVSLILIHRLRLYQVAHRNSEPPAETWMGSVLPDYLPLRAPSLTQLNLLFSDSLPPLPLPPLLRPQNRRWARGLAGQAMVCRRRYVPYARLSPSSPDYDLDVVEGLHNSTKNGWSPGEVEGKWSYGATNETPVNSTLTLQLDRPIIRQLSLVVRVSGTSQQGSVRVVLSCQPHSSSAPRLWSSPITLDANIVELQTVFQLRSLQLIWDWPSNPPLLVLSRTCT